MPDPTIRPVPLDQLEISTANVRKTGAGESAHAELKASIAAHGLIENLNVRQLSPDTQGKPRYAVVAGGRRLAALSALATEGTIAENHPVPCRIVDNRTDDAEISLAENVVRVAMHPADQIQAFSSLADDGASVAGIAARFGVSERTVEQRLRLGNAAPEIVDGYRAGEIDLETLKAFAVTADRARQMTVWERVSQQGYRPSAWQIRQSLTQDRIPARAAIAAFVGVDAYEAAGGVVDRDLFADQYEEGIWFEDSDLLSKLATARLQAAADELATRWKWAEPHIEIGYTDLAGFGRVEATPADMTDDEKAESERLNLRHDQLANLDDDEWTEELLEEATKVERRLSEIDEQVHDRAVFSTEQMAMAGAIVTIDQQGTMQLILGLVKPEDLPAPDTRADAQAGASANGVPSAISTGATTAAGVAPPALPPRPVDKEAEARKQAGVGIGLADDLRAIRTTLVKAHLADDFDAAFDLVLYQMARSVFTNGYHDHALDISMRRTADRPTIRNNDDNFHHSNPGEAMLDDVSHLSFDWLTIEDGKDSFAALSALPGHAKHALFAACVARSLKGQLSFEAHARPETEATVARLDVDFASHLRPTADIYWSRIRKHHMLNIARQTLAESWVQAHRKDKKTELADAMEAAFADSPHLPEHVTKETRASALTWTMPGFDAFDSGHIDDPDEAPGTEAETQVPAEQETAETAPSTATAPPAAPAPGDTVPEHDPGDTSRPAGQQDPDALQQQVDAMNSVPTADGGPRVIISTVGFNNGNAQEDAAAPEPPVPPLPGNGVDTAAEGDALDIPAFLRRS